MGFRDTLMRTTWECGYFGVMVMHHYAYPVIFFSISKTDRRAKGPRGCKALCLAEFVKVRGAVLHYQFNNRKNMESDYWSVQKTKGSTKDFDEH